VSDSSECYRCGDWPTEGTSGAGERLCARHAELEDLVNEVAWDGDAPQKIQARYKWFLRMHKASSEDGEHCAVCGQRVKPVPGGSGTALVHSDSGAVAAPNPAVYQAQTIHEEAQRLDRKHDRGGCWCCCQDCDWDHEAVEAGRLERGEGW
jgi:hypothetical protein